MPLLAVYRNPLTIIQSSILKIVDRVDGVVTEPLLLGQIKLIHFAFQPIIVDDPIAENIKYRTYHRLQVSVIYSILLLHKVVEKEPGETLRGRAIQSYEINGSSSIFCISWLHLANSRLDSARIGVDQY